MLSVILVVTPWNWTSGEVKAGTGRLEPRKGYTMTQRRTFTAEFKTQVVLDLVSGAHSPAELCRQHQLNPQVLARWKTELLERAPLVFEQDQKRSAEQERIAE